MEPELLRDLFAKYINGTAHDNEVKLLEQTIDKLSNKELEVILEPLAESQVPDENFNVAAWELRLQEIISHTAEKQPAKLIRFGIWKKLIAAAVIIGLLLAGYLLYTDSGSGAVPDVNNPQLAQDIHPGGEGAILKLADGSQIILTDSDNGTVASQGNINIVKKQGQVSYDFSNTNPEKVEVGYNTMITPKGRLFSLVLSDGSKVWLNAASSIRFPTVFVNGERRVEITGEAYFEINPAVTLNKDGIISSGGTSKAPFIVSLNGMEIEVLGTKFNVNVYEDESFTRTTLLEGSIRLYTGSKNKPVRSTILIPGQQAKVYTKDKIEVDHNINVEKVMAWKNGFFYFDRASLEEVLRQISRWYDVEIEYEGKIPTRAFGGKISRSSKLSEVLAILNETNVRYKLEGRKIVVLP